MRNMSPEPASGSEDRFERFRVDPWIDRLGGFVARNPGLCKRLGNFETRLLSASLDGIEIRAPIFIAGLARSGTTILLECLAAHPETASHRYRDFPGVLAPVFWDRVSTRLYDGLSAPKERAHGDGIAVTPDSPEAVEEMLWMAFYPGCHDPSQENRLAKATDEFAAFYREHIKKLLFVREGRRYLAKGNYNLARLDALRALFPDARFIVPVRDPVSHVASLMRQQALFSAAEAKHPAALRYMQRVGHFEFGLDRRPLNLGDAEKTQDVERLWREGHEVEGWSRYWALVHGFLADRLARDAALREAALIVHFDALCADPRGILGRLLGHTGLSADEAWLGAAAERIHAPAKRRPPFDETDRQTILRITGEVASRLGCPMDRALA